MAALASAQLPLAFYEELPYAASEGAEGAIDAAVQQLSMTLQTELKPAFAAEVQATEAAVDAAVVRKIRAAWCYDSQIDEGITTEIAEFCRRYQGRERLWGNVAWSGDGALIP